MRRVLVVRLSRQPQDAALWSRVAGAHPRARWGHLLGSLCEGEMRTGTPWPGFQRILWHRWRDRLPDWLALGGVAARGARPPESSRRAGGSRQAIAVCAARREQAEGMLDVLGAAGHHVLWSRPDALAAGVGWTAILWDESALDQLGFDRWAQAALFRTPGERPPRQAVLFTAPRTPDRDQMQRAGVARLFSKPVDLPALAGWLADAKPPAPNPRGPTPLVQ